MSILDRIRAHGAEPVRHGYKIRLINGSRLPSSALAWLRAPRNKAALLQEIWPEFDFWDERAAIREFDGGQDRQQAEDGALEEAEALC